MVPWLPHMLLGLSLFSAPAPEAAALRLSQARVLGPLWLMDRGGWHVPSEVAWREMTGFAVDRALEQAQGMAMPERLQEISGRFLDAPYLASPLGEGGRGPDPDPLMRFDGADCTTFVEQVMAMVRARDLSEALYWLRRIRYQQGRIDYIRRKHFMMAQWIPDNQAEGFLRDRTAEIAGGRLQWVEKCIGPEIWARRKPDKPWPELREDQVPDGCFRLPILPLEEVLSKMEDIPSGSLVNIIRENYQTMPTRVTHQGIFIRRGGRAYLRHAGRAVWGRVVDEDFVNFVKRNQAYGKWPVNGFNFQEILGHNKP